MATNTRLYAMETLQLRLVLQITLSVDIYTIKILTYFAWFLCSNQLDLLHIRTE